jgi:hypothetical protein
MFEVVDDVAGTGWLTIIGSGRLNLDGLYWDVDLTIPVPVIILRYA